MTARARIIYNLWVCSTTMHSHLDALFYFGLKNIGCYEILCTACKNTKNPGVLGGSLQCRWILAGRVHCLICCSGRHQSAANPKWRLNTRKMKTTKTAYLGVAFFLGGEGGGGERYHRNCTALCKRLAMWNVITAAICHRLRKVY